MSEVSALSDFNPSSHEAGIETKCQSSAFYTRLHISISPTGSYIIAYLCNGVLLLFHKFQCFTLRKYLANRTLSYAKRYMPVVVFKIQEVCTWL